MASYLVTGGAGFIGSHLVDSLLARGDHVVVLDDISTGNRSNLSFHAELVEGDIRDPTLVTSLMEGKAGCFHLAAISSVERSNQAWRDTHTINLGGTITVLESARATPSRPAVPVVYASSAAVYGNSPQAPLTEEAPTRPLTAYGADKLACELHARVGGEIHRLPTLGLRFFNVYGPRQDPHSPYSGVISLFMAKARRNENLTIHGDGLQVRDFIHVNDVVRFLLRGMERTSTSGEVCNVCTGHPTTIRDLASLTITCTHASSAIVHAPSRVGDIRISIGSPELAAQRLGLRAETDLPTGLATMADSLMDTLP